MATLPLIFRNLSSNLFLYGAKLSIGIISLPICLHAFGNEVFGLYLLAFGLSSSFTTFDFGASKSAMRFAVEYMEDGSVSKFSAAISTASTLALLSAIVIAGILSIMGLFSESLFHLDGDLIALGFPIFVLAACNAAFLTLGAIPQQLLQANNYFHLRNSWQYLPQVCNLGILLFISVSGSHDIILYSICTVCVSTLSSGIDFWLVKQKSIVKHIYIQFKIQKHSAAVTQYSFRAFLHAIISFLAVQADKLIIGTVLNVGAVTTYTIISKPYYLLRGMVSTGYLVFQPTLTGLHMQTDRSHFTEYSSRIIRSTFIAIAAICSVAGICFEQGLHIWLNTSEYDTYAIWGIISLISISITMLYTPFYRTMVYSQQLGTILNFSFIAVPVNVIISIALTHYYDFYGVIIGTLIQMLMESSFILYQAKRQLQVDLSAIFTPSFIARITAIVIILILGRTMVLNLQLDLAIKFAIELVFIIALTVIAITTVQREGLFRSPIKVDV